MQQNAVSELYYWIHFWIPILHQFKFRHFS
ncbi:unnamed protein product [Onchocerca flexuosa]|uniref:Uncharacterized protein n=1 Tax=Onchocerca flexuosa TaxID=387005 RepID=A0A183HCU6_9BILA|nr:unnamed protein product [Onchocerca flexuosa]